MSETIAQKLEKWKAPGGSATAADALNLAQIAIELEARLKAAGEAVETLQQTVAEVAHAHANGTKWYSGGERGLYMQVRMWIDKGTKAAVDAIRACNLNQPWGL